MSGHVVDRIADYLAGRLGSAERRAFEDHVVACDDCRSELEWARRLRSEALRQGLRHLDPMRLLAIAERRLAPDADEEDHLRGCPECRRELDWASGLPEESGGDEAGGDDPVESRPRPRRWPWLAAAAAAVLAVALFGIDREPALDPATLVTLEPLPVRITRSVPATDPFEIARLAGLEAYADGDFEAARDELEAAVGIRPDADEARLYLASAALLTGEREPAVLDLRRVVDDAGPGPVHDEAAWLLANAVLLERDVDEARGLLSGLAGGDGHRSADAAALLESLRALD